MSPRFTTSSGRVKDKKKIERAKRYLKQVSAIEVAQSKPGSSFDKMKDAEFATLELQLDHLGALNTHRSDEAMPGTFPQLLAHNTSSLSHQESSTEIIITLQGRLADQNSGVARVVDRKPWLIMRNEWPQLLPPAKFEAFLNSKGMALTSTSNRLFKQSSSKSLDLTSVVDILSKSDERIAKNIGRVETSFRLLSAFIPTATGSVISEQQITDTHIIKMMFFSMNNGFAGINQIPIESLLLCLRRLEFFQPSFRQLLLASPSPAKRCFVDNLFKASINANFTQMVKQILTLNLVDVDNLICVHESLRCTPIEKAAYLKNFDIVRALADHGADVEKTYIDPQSGLWDWPCGALECLLVPRWTVSQRIQAPSPELLNTIGLLIAKGSKVRVTKLNSMANYFATCEVAILLSRAVSRAARDHRAFFEKPKATTNRAPVIETATLPNADFSLSIMENMIKICQSHGGLCLAEFADVMEEAAIEAAKRGRLGVVELIIDYAEPRDLILCAAIRSQSHHLIEFLLRRELSLNPPARFCQALDYPTTPFAEAMRSGNSRVFNLLLSKQCGTYCSLTKHGRLEAAILGAVAHRFYADHHLKHLLSIASSTQVKLRIPSKAMELALHHGNGKAAHLLIEEGATLGEAALEAALESRNREMLAIVLATDLPYGSSNISITKAVLEWPDPSVLESMLYTIPNMQMHGAGLAGFCSHCIDIDNLDLFRSFVESTSDPRKDWDECLAMAVRKEHHTMASYLLQKGANPSDSSVLAAALPDHPEMLSYLFGNVVRSPQKCAGANTLRYLMPKYMESNQGKILDQLLEYGAVNLITPENISLPGVSTCVTPLGLAILGIPDYCDTNVPAIEKFLEAGSDPNGLARLELFPYRRVTALMAALETGRQDIVKLMIDQKADVNLPPRLSLRRTPLQYAAELGNLEMIRLLLEKGADVNSPPAFQGGGTALQFAAISGTCNVVAELLEHGASLDTPPSKVDGRWPLEGAAEHGRLDMIQLLWNVRNHSPGNIGFEKRQCLRAMDFARENGHFGCRDLISELSGLSVEMLEAENYGVPWLV